MTPTYDPPWRTGSKVGRTIYDAQNRLIGVMDTPELAERAVAAVNAQGDKRHCFECGSPEHGASACPKVPGDLREHYRRTRGAIEFLEDATETPEPVCPTCGQTGR